MVPLRGALLLTVLGAVFAGPLSHLGDLRQCSITCPETTLLSYEQGQTYEYSYEADVKTSIPTTTEEHSSLHMRATVQLEALSRCEMVLTVSDVSLQDSAPQNYEGRQHVSGSEEFKRAVQQRALRFSIVSGIIDSVCPEDGDEAWVVNIKRGIVSAFQNSMESLSEDLATVETDVLGECPVQYEAAGSSWGGVHTVRKTKDLLGCTERHEHWSAFQSSPYKTHSAIQSMPLMRSTHECEQKLKTNGRLISSACKESHVFRPFSRDGSGATTEVTSKLEFYRETQAGSSRQIARISRSSLLFDHTPSEDQSREDYSEVEQTLTELCRQTQQEITPEIPHLFARLVRTLRRLETPALLRVSRSTASACPKATKFFRDAIPMLGSSASVSLIRDLVSGEQVNDVEADMWITSLAFIPKPSSSMLREAKELLTVGAVYRKASLAVSSLVHSFCRENTGCQERAEVAEIVRIFEDNLAYNCRAETADQHDRILMSLKALGNVGYASQAVATLNRCATNADLDMEVRVAAVEAFRRMPCDADRMEMASLYGRSEEDSELRIHAYLTIMRCPDEATLSLVRRRLEEEDVNQVGSFVWTHLTNLQETDSPHKQAVRQILQDERLQRAFDMDKRKYSRNIELSGFSHLLNAGANLESNLIWSQNSFVPRSAMVNLTVDLFGESVNLIEIGGRVQGLERMLERAFGEQSNEVERPNNPFRSLDDRYQHERDETRGSYYMRVFGNEIRYDDFHDLDLSSLKDRFNYLDWLIELSKEHSFEVTKSVMFLDSTIVVPTVAGLPLRLSADGTSTINVDVSGKLDIRQMFAQPSTFDIDAVIKPSAALEVTFEMGVDAHVAKTGLKMVSSLHTSTVASSKVKLLNGRVFSMEVNVPQERIEILNAQNKFFITYRDEAREQQMFTDERVEKSYCSQSKVLGLELCGEMSLPSTNKRSNAPWLPLTGPASLHLFVSKKDTFSSYVVAARLTTENEIDTALLSFNTPGSSVDRDLTAEFTMNRPEKTVNFNLRTPWKSATVDGSVVSTDARKRVTATVTLDANTVYSGVANLDIDAKKYTTRYVPSLEMTVPGMEALSIDGDIFVRPGKKGEVTLRARNLLRDTIKLKGNFELRGKGEQAKYESELEIESGLINGKLSGYVDKMIYSTEVNAELEYTLPSSAPHKLTFNNKLKHKVVDKVINVGMDTTWTSTLWSQYNFDSKYAFDYTFTANGLTGNMNSNLNAGFDETRRIIFSETVGWVLQGPENRLDFNANFRLPCKNLDYEARLEHLHNAAELRSLVNVKYGDNQEGTASMNLRRESESPLKITAEGRLQYPGREMSLVETIEEKAPKEYHQELNVQLAKYQHIRVTSVYKSQPRHELVADITMPGSLPINLKGHLNPVANNLQARAELNYDNRQFFVDTNWEHSGNANAFTTRANFEAFHPQRRVTATSTVSRQGDVFRGAVDTKWNAGRNDEEKLSLTGRVTASKETPSAEIALSLYPNHFVNLETSGKYETQGWYKTTSDVEGSAQLRSSFGGFEDLSASFKHDRARTGYTNEGMVAWAPNKKVEGSFTIDNVKYWTNVKTAMNLKTPFEGIRTLATTHAHKLKGNTLETTAKVEYDGQSVNFAANGKLDIPNHLFEGQTTFTSPYRYLENLAANGKYSGNGPAYEANLAASWAPNRQVSGEFVMNHNRNGAQVNNQGHLTVSTPLTAEPARATWEHQHNAGSIATSAEAGVASHSLKYNIQGMNKQTYKKRRITTDVTVESSIPGAEDLRLSLEHQHDRRAMSFINSKASVQWAPNQAVTYEHNVDRDAYRSLNGKAKFTSPWRRYSTITLDSSYTNAEGHVSSTNEFKWGPNKKLTAVAEGTYGSNAVQGQVRITTPFEPLERLVVNAQHNKQDDGIWVSHGDVEHNTNPKVEIDTKVGLGARKLVAVDVKSPWRYVRAVHAQATYSGSPRNFETTAEVNHEALTDKITAVVSADTRDTNRMSGQVRIATPFLEARSININAEHRADGNSYSTEGSFVMPQYRGGFKHAMTLHAWSNFNTDTMIEYQPDRVIQMTTAFSASPKITGRATFKSPFAYYEELNLNFDHEGQPTSFVTSGELSYSPRHKLTGNVEFRLQGTTLTTTARFTTPYEQARRIQATVSHSGTRTAFQNDGSFELNDKRFSANTEFSLQGTSLSAKSTIQTPFTGFETVSAEVTHNGAYDNFNNNALLVYGTRQITAQSAFSKQGTTVTGNAKIITPYPQFNTLIVKFEHKGKNWRNFENEATVNVNGQKYTGDSELRYYGKVFRAKAELGLPEKYSVRVNHKGTRLDFSNNAVVTIPGERLSGTSSFKLADQAIEGAASVDTTFQVFKKLELNFNHNGGLNDFTTTGTIITPHKKYTRFATEITHRGNLNSFQTTAKVETPFASVPEITSSVSHQGSLNEFTSGANVEYSGKRITGSATFKNAEDIQGTASLQTPYAGLENFVATFRHTGGRRSFSTSGSVQTPFRNFERMNAELVHSGDLSRFTTTAKAESSYPGYERFNVEAKHEGNYLNFQSSLKVETPFRRLPAITLSVNHRGSWRDNLNCGATCEYSGKTITSALSFALSEREVQATGSLQTPYPGYERFGVSVSHSGELRNFKTTGQITTPFRGYESSGVTLEHSTTPSGFKTMGEITTSIPGYDRFSFELEHTQNGNTIQTTGAVTSPINGYERFGFKLNHEGNLSTFHTSGEITTSLPGYNKFGFDFNHNGDSNSFHTTGELSTPISNYDRFGFNVNHNGNRKNFKTNGEVTSSVPGYQRFAAALEKSGTLKNLAIKTAVETPFRGYGRFAADMTHANNRRGIKTTGNVATSIRGYDNFGFNMQHTGDAGEFETVASLSTPIRGYETFAAKLNHKQAGSTIKTDGEVTTSMPGYHRFSAGVEKSGTYQNLALKGKVETPFEGLERFSGEATRSVSDNGFHYTASAASPVRGYENFGLDVEHSGDRNNFNTAVAATSSVSGYENFGVNVNHNGDRSNFRSSAEMNTPIRGYERILASLEKASTPSSLQTKAHLETPTRRYSNFDLSLNHNRRENGFVTKAALETSIPEYRKFAAGLTHNGRPRAFDTKAEIETSIPGYEKFAAGLTHNGHASAFDTKAQVETSIRGYNKFAAGLTHNALADGFNTKAQLETPIRGYEKFDAGLTHNVLADGFDTKAQMETSIPGYNRFTAGLTHNGNFAAFDTNAQVETSIRGYNKFAAGLKHNGNRSQFRTTANMETPFPGHERYVLKMNHNSESNIESNVELQTPSQRYAAAVNHRGNARAFNTDLTVNTPYPGYENFGLSVNHQGELSSFTHTGTVTLPFPRLPEIKYTFSHRGNLHDFTSDGSVEYNRKKIEGTVNFKAERGYSESTIEGSAMVKTPYEAMREMSLTASHVRRNGGNSGALEITKNGQKLVDADYHYTTPLLRSITVNVRHPQPVQTTISFSGEASTYSGDAVVVYRNMNYRADFSLSNQAGDKQMSVKAVMPRRTVGFTTSTQVTDDRLVHKAEVQWGNGEDKKASYELEASRSSRQNKKMLDASLKVTSAPVNLEATFAHVCVPGRQYTTELAVQTSTRTAFKQEVTINDNGFTHTITLQHPRIPGDVHLACEGTLERNAIDGKSVLRIGRETVEFTGRVADESTYEGQKWVSRSRLSHATSGLDVQWDGELSNNRERALANMELKYMMTRARQFRTASLRSEINKLRKELDIVMVHPLKEVHLTARQEPAEEGIRRYSAVLRCSREIRAEFECNCRQKNVDFKLYYTPENFLHANARFDSPRELTAEVYRQHNGKRVQEALVNLALRENHQLTGRAYLRPHIASDVIEVLRSTDMMTGLRTSRRELIREAADDLRLKGELLARSFEPVAAVVQELSDEVSAKWRDASQQWREMYARNDYYLKDICLGSRRAINYVWERIQKDIAVVADIARKVSARNYVRASALYDDWKESLKLRAANAFHATKNYAATANRRMSEYATNLRPYLDMTNEKMAEMKERYMDAVDRVRAHPVVQKVMNKLAAIRGTDLYQPLRARAAGFSEGATSYVSWAINVLKSLAAREEVKAIRQRLVSAIEHSNWWMNYLEIQHMVQGAFEDFSLHGLRTIKANVMQAIDSVVRRDLSRFTVWDPQGGDFQFEFYMPLPLDDLQTVPKVKVELSKYVRLARQWLEHYMPESDFHPWETYYQYRPSFNWRDWIPPFSASASLAGNQHFMTFDKRFYEFAGDCSYLLARDFIDGSFSVVVNYERTRTGSAKKSMTVTSNGRSLEIFPDGRLIMDGSVQELPVHFDNTTVVREGSLIQLTNTKGVAMSCNLPNDICSVTVSGWYFGKTAGLFGTYNNEQVDDLTTASRARATNLPEFGSSWAVGQTCRPVNRAVDLSNEVGVENRRYRHCAKYFDARYSPFRSCFKVVDPKPFMTMCLNERPVNDNEMEREEDTCKVAAFYVHKCREHKVPLRMPGICVRCEVAESGGEFIQGENKTLSETTVPKSADVVLVIEHDSCNTEMLAGLKKVVEAMDKALKAEGLKNNRFSLVGYGGRGIFAEPRVHTMDGQIFNSVDKIQQGLANVNTDAGEEKDPLLALRFAANMPFRAGVSKSIVLLPCSQCEQKQVSFAEMQHVLLLRDIRLHVLMAHSFRLKGSSTKGKTAYIFGADRDRVYTRKDAGQSKLKGDADLRNQILMPKDLCVALTEETRGSIFNSLQWTQNRPILQKRFVDVLVRLIADRATPTPCQVCECVADPSGVGMAVCHSCEMPDPIYAWTPDFKTEVVAEPDEGGDKTGPAVKPVKPTKSPKDKIISKAERKRLKQLAREAKKARQLRRLRLKQEAAADS